MRSYKRTVTDGEAPLLQCPQYEYKCARKTTKASLWDGPHKMKTLEGECTSTYPHMHVLMPTQESTHTHADTCAQTHICNDISLNNFTVSSSDKVKKSNGLDTCCTDSNNRVATWRKVLPADLGQLTLKKWWFPQSTLSPWCNGILSVTGRPLTYDRAFARGSINSPPSSITIMQCSGWIPSPDSWMSCSMGASRPPTKVRSCAHKERYQKSAYVTEMKS